MILQKGQFYLRDERMKISRRGPRELICRLPFSKQFYGLIIVSGTVFWLSYFILSIFWILTFTKSAFCVFRVCKYCDSRNFQWQVYVSFNYRAIDFVKTLFGIELFREIIINRVKFSDLVISWNLVVLTLEFPNWKLQ